MRQNVWIRPRAQAVSGGSDGLRGWPCCGVFNTSEVTGQSVDLAHGNIQYGNAKAQQIAASLRKVPGTGPSIDLAHAQRPTMSPKDPRYEAALRANAEREFQIAPVK